MRTKPVLFLGNGARVSGWADRFLAGWDTPILLSWRAMDLLPDDDPRFFGRPGSIASKYANLIVQNCDFLSVVGARLDYPTTGYRPEEFAPKAAREGAYTCSNEWWEQCRGWKKEHPLPPTTWVDWLSNKLQEGDVLVFTSSGVTNELICQKFKVKKNQRVIFSPGLGAMGAGLPQAVGAAFAFPDRKIYCVEGDGSIQLNISTLQTIRQHRLNIEVIVVQNNGYASIRNMQKRHFDGRLLGCDPSSGMTLPDIERVAFAYGVPVTIVHADPNAEIKPRLRSTRNPDGTITPGRLEDIE